MRSLRRRKQNIWICKASIDDSHMEPVTKYSKPEKHQVSVSNTSGTPHELPVGLVSEYSRYFISYDREFNPKEGMVLFVDREPVLNKNGNLAISENIYLTSRSNKYYTTRSGKKITLAEGDGELITKPDYVLTHIMDTAKGTIARYGIKKIAGEESESEPEPEPVEPDDGDDDEQDDQG